MEKELDLETYIAQQWKALPNLTQQVIKEGTYREVTQQALNKAGADNTEEYLEQLSFEALIVILNLQTVDDFRENVKLISSLTDTQVETIVRELNAQLFSTLNSVNESFEGTILEHIFFVKKINDLFLKLPAETQEIIQKLSFDCIGTLAHRHLFNKKQINALRTMIAEVMVGLINTTDFVKHAQNDLALSYTDAVAAANEVEKEVFTPVRESLLNALTPKNVKEKVVSKQEQSYSDEWKKKVVEELYKEKDVVATEKKLRDYLIGLHDDTDDGGECINKEVDAYIKKRWQTLPPLAKRVLIENTYKEILQFALNKADAEDTEPYLHDLQLDILLVVLGLLPKKSFIEKMDSNTAIKNKKAFTNELDAQIFSSIIQDETE